MTLLLFLYKKRLTATYYFFFKTNAAIWIFGVSFSTIHPSRSTNQSSGFSQKIICSQSSSTTIICYIADNNYSWTISTIFSSLYIHLRKPTSFTTFLFLMWSSSSSSSSLHISPKFSRVAGRLRRLESRKAILQFERWIGKNLFKETILSLIRLVYLEILLIIIL